MTYSRDDYLLAGDRCMSTADELAAAVERDGITLEQAMHRSNTGVL